MSYTPLENEEYLATNNTVYYGWVGRHILDDDDFYPVKSKRAEKQPLEPFLKICNKCHKTKFLNEFYIADKKTGLLQGICKSCCSETMTKYRQENKEKVRAKEKEWMERNREKLNASISEYYRKRYRSDPVFKFICLTRSRIRDAVTRRTASYVDLLGCSGDKAFNFLVSKFTPDMSEKDFLSGDIHIDHIRPVASFDLEDPEQQKECFHYTNLQPLWAKDNLLKSSVWDKKRY